MVVIATNIVKFADIGKWLGLFVAMLQPGKAGLKVLGDRRGEEELHRSIDITQFAKK